MEHHLCLRHSTKCLHTECLVQVPECRSSYDSSHLVDEEFTVCGACSQSVFLHLCSTLRTLQVRLAVRSLSPRDLSSSANSWQNQDSDLVLLTLHC